MTKKSVGEAMAALGVILGLLFVGLEIRQNTDAVKGATLQAIGEMSQTQALAIAENPELAVAWSRAYRFGPDSLDAEQAAIMSAFTFAAVRIIENRYRQLQLGILTEEEAFTSGGYSSLYRSYYFRDWWERTGRVSTPEDASVWIEDVILPLAATEPPAP